jgi:hypothetical protein
VCRTPGVMCRARPEPEQPRAGGALNHEHDIPSPQSESHATSHWAELGTTHTPPVFCTETRSMEISL